MRRADDDHVTDDERRGVEAELGGVEIEALLIDLGVQIDRSVASESGNLDARPRVERLHPVTGRDIDDSPIGAISARPVGEAAPGTGANRVLTPPPFVLAVHPQ